jgi:hypothetical protein
MRDCYHLLLLAQHPFCFFVVICCFSFNSLRFTLVCGKLWKSVATSKEQSNIKGTKPHQRNKATSKEKTLTLLYIRLVVLFGRRQDKYLTVTYFLIYHSSFSHNHSIPFFFHDMNHVCSLNFSLLNQSKQMRRGVNTHTHSHTHIHTYAYTHTYAHTYIHAHAHVCTHTYTRPFLYRCVYL